MDLNCNQSFNFSSFYGTIKIFKTHTWEDTHMFLNFVTLNIHSTTFITRKFFKTFINLACPKNLETKKSNLRGLRRNKFFQTNLEYLLGSSTGNILQSLLHIWFKLGEPIFNISFTSDIVTRERNIFFISTNNLLDGSNLFKSRVLLILSTFKGNLSDSIEKLFKIFLDRSRFRTLWKNLK